MKFVLDEIFLTKEYVAKFLNTTPEFIAAIKEGIKTLSEEQEIKLEELIGTRTLWRDDSDEAEIERLKKLRSK